MADRALPLASAGPRYLVDRANLLLFLDQGRHEKRLLSTQECHDLMAGIGVSMEQYLIYCKLARCGYIVQRHPAHFVLSISEAPMEIWSNWQQPGAQPQQEQQQHAVFPRQPAAAATAPPPSKRRKLHAGDTHQEAAGSHWFPALAESRTWLSFLPPDFCKTLPRVEVVPDAAVAARAAYPQMLPLQKLPTEELVPTPSLGHQLLVSYCVCSCSHRVLRC